jgi:ferredoxin-type protein NapH
MSNATTKPGVLEGKNKLINFRFLILRRLTQLLILGLYVSAFSWNQSVLAGNLSATSVFNTVILADPYAVLQMLLAGVDLDVRTLIGATIILLFYGLIAGRAFCSWVCPINILTDAAAWANQKLPYLHGPQNRSIRFNKNLRYWILGLSLVLSLLTGVAAFEAISPISLLHRGIVYGLSWAGISVLAAVFLYDLLIQKRGFCGHLCPLGAFYATITKLNLVRITYDRDSCSDCMDCKVVCPENQVLPMISHSSSVITDSACTNCGRCIDVCNDHSLKFILRLDREDFKDFSRNKNVNLYAQS